MAPIFPCQEKHKEFGNFAKTQGNLFSTKTEYVQTCFHRENDPSCGYGVKPPTLTHSLSN